MRATRRSTAALAVVLVLAGCGSGAHSSAPVPSAPPTNDLKVGLLEYRLALSAGTLVPGSVTVTATNAGSTSHDVRLRQGERVLGATSVLSPGGREVLRVDVQPGQPVRLDCTVAGHAEAGMHATLAVAGGRPGTSLDGIVDGGSEEPTAGPGGKE